MARTNNLSIISRGLRYKLRIAVSLMVILPILVCLYLVSNFILPQQKGFRIEIIVSIMVSIFIALIGFYLVKEIFDRILSVSSEAKLIAAGDIGRTLKVSREDELGDLGEALNQLTQRIRSNMDELKSYSEKTTEINLSIQRRVLVLSSLLQVSSLISQGARLEDIFRLTTEKSRLLANSDASFLLFREEGVETFSMKAADGAMTQEFMHLQVKPEGVFEKVIQANKPFVLDGGHLLPQNLSSAFYEKFRLKNALVLPVYLKGKVRGVLGIGNVREKFLYGEDDIELLDIFAKQISIAVENDILMHRVEKLEIKDALTGLYNEAFIRTRLQEEIKRAIAYRRPCGFILFDIDDFQGFHQHFGALQAEAALKKMANLIKEAVSEIDRVGRFSDSEFAVILPEKNKRQAQEIAEDIRKKIALVFQEEQEAGKKLTLSGGVVENPLDGVSNDELINRAKELIAFAKAKGPNRIISRIG